MSKETFSQRFQMKADMPHPVGNEITAKFDLLTCVYGFLTVERQAVSVFGDSDARQQSLGWQAAFNQMGRRWRLNDVFAAGGVNRR